jgi:DNA-binding transcriptional MerR regulator
MAKGPEAFRTISEAADELDVPQHVLRFWETKFAFIRPMKRAGGRRFYRPADIVLLRGLRRLLHEDGYTIKGVQRLHREQGLSLFTAGERGAGDHAPSSGRHDAAHAGLDEAARDRLVYSLAELEALKQRLDTLLRT